MNTKALIRAAALVIVLIAVATIGSELSPAFKYLLTMVGGHHWIGKSVLSIVFFAALYALFSIFSDDSLSLKDTWLLVVSVIVSGLAILIFYVQHAS